jgi:outer membrane receptor protein involved in Fe transport
MMPLGDFGDLTLHGDYSERAKQFYDLANTQLPGLYSPAYGIGNLRATLAPSALPIRISAFVKNVGNKQYYQNIAANGQSGLAVPGAPRVFGGAIDFEF